MTKRIAIIVEGATEKAFKRILQDYLGRKLAGEMPKLTFISEDGRIQTRDKLKRDVGRLLKQYDAVIALTDVYTGPRPFEFVDAVDAKNKMKQWVGPEPNFYPHAAQYEFEAWLLPYWPRIQHLAGSDRTAPSSNPETVNHDKPPAQHLKGIPRRTQQAALFEDSRRSGYSAWPGP